MNIHETLTAEFMKLAIDELNESGIEVDLVAQHQVLSDWCDAYEDVPPRNRAERTVLDALIDARERVNQHIRESIPKIA